MAAIPTILKGDDSGSIVITMATGRVYTGATLVVAYQGVTKTFTNLTPGGAVNLVYTHDETAKMSVKTAPVLMRLVGQYGSEETVENAEMLIKVTDCLAEVNAGGSFVVRPGAGSSDPTKVPITDVGDMATRYTLADLQAKVNQIVRVLAQRSLLSLGAALCAASVFGGVQRARLDSLYNDSLVVTNVTDISGEDTNAVHKTDLAWTNRVKSVNGMTGDVVIQTGGGISASAVTNIAEYVVSTNGFAYTSVTNGLASTNYVNAATAGMATKTWVRQNYYNRQVDITMDDGIRLDDDGYGTALLYYNYLSFKNTGAPDNFSTKYQHGCIYNYGNTYSFPSATGTLALKSEIPTVPANIVTYSSGDPQTSSAILSSANDTAENIASQKVANVSAIVATWENFLDGSNVVFSITNYISGAYSTDYAKLRILEMRNGAYSEVYNSHTEITNHIGKFKSGDFKTATNAIVTATNNQLANKADKAWGQYTSSGGEAPSNTVYMTAPNTVFAGGMEYERVAVGEGAVCVLTTKGAPVWTSGDEGTFKFQDDGGTNYFGFAKTDSYTIGCDTDAISVQNHIVSLTYNVTMSGVPCIWYKADIGNTNAWEKLNLPDGTAVPGASHSVNWDQSPAAGTEVCYINCPEAKGFFKASIEVTGSAKFMTNMPADFGGGILCTDGIHKVKINWNNGSPTFVEVQ